MALITVNFVSKCLMRTVTVNAIIPFDKIFVDESHKAKPPYKTLYLLHGIFGNYTDWVSGTCIQRWAEEKNLAVIMPSGENHFYVDCDANGEKFSQFIGEELPQKMEELFPLSSRKEDRFIGGLSMGGYGAITNGLRYYHRFSRIACLSAAFHMIDAAMNPDRVDFARNLFSDQWYPTVFGTECRNTNKDHYYMTEQLKDNPEKPELFICCGLSDHLLAANRKYYTFAKENNFNVTYIEDEGGHEWDFWNRYIKKIIDWLPLDEKSEGINSGHISNN